MTSALPTMCIPLLAAQLPSLDYLAPYLACIDRNRWYSNFGPLVEQLETRLSETFATADGAAPHVITVGNGTAGIDLALRALGLPAGAPVLVPALTFIATATAVLSAGLTPVVCDVDPDSWLLTPDLASKVLAGMPLRAVVPVAAYGCPQDTQGWSRFHAETGLPVVIDAAAAFGNQMDCGPTCSVYSLHATKPLAAGEGGFVVTRDWEFAQAVRQLSNFGINLTASDIAPIGAVTMVGTNAKMSEYHAAVGLASLDEWPENSTRRRKIYRAYTEAIRTIPRLKSSWQTAPTDCVRSVCCLLLDSRRHRDYAEAVLAAAGVGTRRWYLPLVDRHPAFAHITHHPTPVADAIAERLLGIPFHLNLDSAAQATVIKGLAATV